MTTNSKQIAAQPANQLVFEILLGSIRASVWRSAGESGVWFNTNVCRNYREDTDRWQESRTHSLADLVLVVETARRSADFIVTQEVPAMTNKHSNVATRVEGGAKPLSTNCDRSDTLLCTDSALVYVPTRRQAINVGVLIEVGELARVAGLGLSVALKTAGRVNGVPAPATCDWPSASGWPPQVVCRLGTGVTPQHHANSLFFSVTVPNHLDRPRHSQLKAVGTAGDKANGVSAAIFAHKESPLRHKVTLSKALNRLEAIAYVVTCFDRKRWYSQGTVNIPNSQHVFHDLHHMREWMKSQTWTQKKVTFFYFHTVAQSATNTVKPPPQPLTIQHVPTIYIL